MTVDQLLTVLTSAGAPGVLVLWLWSERKERLRLQRIIEGFLPLMTGTQRAMRNVTRVVGGDGDEDGS